VVHEDSGEVFDKIIETRYGGREVSGGGFRREGVQNDQNYAVANRMESRTSQTWEQERSSAVQDKEKGSPATPEMDGDSADKQMEVGPQREPQSIRERPEREKKKDDKSTHGKTLPKRHLRYAQKKTGADALCKVGEEQRGSSKLKGECSIKRKHDGLEERGHELLRQLGTLGEGRSLPFTSAVELAIEGIEH